MQHGGGAYGAYDEHPGAAPALGVVADEGRGSLPFALIHGEALVACAAWALGEAGVTLVDLGTEWAGLVDADEPFVVHDSLCPMTPSSFIASCVARAVSDDSVVVAVAPDSGDIASPVVLPASVVARLDALPSTDLEALVVALREVGDVRFEPVLAPPSARRVRSIEEVRALQADTLPPVPQ